MKLRVSTQITSIDCSKTKCAIAIFVSNSKYQLSYAISILQDIIVELVVVGLLASTG